MGAKRLLLCAADFCLLELGLETLELGLGLAQLALASALRGCLVDELSRQCVDVRLSILNVYTFSKLPVGIAGRLHKRMKACPCICTYLERILPSLNGPHLRGALDDANMCQLGVLAFLFVDVMVGLLDCPT